MNLQRKLYREKIEARMLFKEEEEARLEAARQAEAERAAKREKRKAIFNRFKHWMDNLVSDKEN